MNARDSADDPDYAAPRMSLERLVEHRRRIGQNAASIKSDYLNRNYDFAPVSFLLLAEIYRFKNKLQDVFKLGNMGEKYLDLNHNQFAIVPVNSDERTHLIMRQKEIIEQERAVKKEQPETDTIENLFKEELRKQTFYRETKKKFSNLQELNFKNSEKNNSQDEIDPYITECGK